MASAVDGPARGARLSVTDPGRAFALFRSRARIGTYNIGYRLAGSLDGYPLPPPRLVHLVIGTRELAWYQLGGLLVQQGIVSFLAKNRIDINAQNSMLDFGCGCGRVVRWFAALKHCEIWGSDYNPDLVRWCQRHLADVGSFKVNGLDPPLDFPDGKFEFVFSYSVLTHLPREKQQPWVDELVRVLKPGGLLLLTVHGERAARRGTRWDRPCELAEHLERDGIVVIKPESAGSNACAAFHAEHYMRGLAGPGLALLDWLPGGVRDGSEQDMYLYRKTPGR
jgi:SAM-dependent methyltransferase